MQDTAVIGLPATELHRYTLTNGKEPELANAGLIWAIQLEGHIPMRVGTAIDPLCVVINGERTIYVPYGLEGEPFSNPYNFEWPQWALPPLAAMERNVVKP